MSNKNLNNEELFQLYLDGELNEEQEKRALHMIADDPEMRSMLRFERTLTQNFNSEPDPDSFSVPENFSSNVMNRIESLDREKEKSAAKGLSLLKPREVSIRPIYAAAAAILMMFTFGYLLLNEQEQDEMASFVEEDRSVQQVAEQESEVWIRFIYFDEEAETMAVAGDFSDWDPVSLTRDEVNGKTVWTGMIPVVRGEHHYMFVKNGNEWVTDPLADVKVDDGFGNKNAVLYL
ncbi:hypothetical protein [Rhodohalobacter sp.]|uniref:hypothetical protein n=1 Tax=Rhodohalobacter sp. TaxID=1974210 RepID=UPI002ACE67E9|nr:hypothetical protein [Rhodohalobacter sp.]MDZ7756569.1 hypothetical protein [Rhodohalobacter sp.]